VQQNVLAGFIGREERDRLDYVCPFSLAFSGLKVSRENMNLKIVLWMKNLDRSRQPFTLQVRDAIVLHLLISSW
jgi:hypothetical protein